MLLATQKDYLDKLDPLVLNRVVQIGPFNPLAVSVARRIIQKTKNRFPGADIRFMGATALGILGEGDVDLYLLSPENEWPRYLPGLEDLFGVHKNKIWHWHEEGIEVSFYLRDPSSRKMLEQIAIFTLLKNDNRLLEEYEILKGTMNGKTYKDYQIAKYEFYNRALGIKSKPET